MDKTNENKADKPSYYFRGEYYYDKESFLKAICEWPEKPLTRQEFDRMFDHVKLEAWVNLSGDDLTNGTVYEPINDILIFFLNEVEKRRRHE